MSSFQTSANVLTLTHANRFVGAHEPIATTQLFQLHSALASDAAFCVNVMLHSDS